jgi:hypothetical protein
LANHTGVRSGAAIGSVTFLIKETLLFAASTVAIVRPVWRPIGPLQEFTRETDIMRWMSGLLVLASVSLLAGCGSKTSNAPVATTLESSAKPTDRLIGRWQGTMQVNEEAVRAAIPADKVEAAITSLQAMRMEMDFRQDGTLLLAGENHGKPYESQASWELVSEDGEKMTLRSVEKTALPGAEPQEKTIDIRFDGQDSFTMPLQTEVAELGSLRFSRLR